ncbi:MAG: hypothetical protein J6T15_02175 [Bacilli bacterium]|nr:hypothetical protein [Bacilli bacterium]
MKTLLKVLNIVYFVLAAAAIACFTVNFIKPGLIPFLKIGVNADLNETNSKEVFSDALLDKFNITREDLFKEGDIKVDVEVKITNQMVFGVWGDKNEEIYITDEFINPTIDGVVEQVAPTFSRVARVAAKSSIKTMVEQKLRDTLPDDKNLYVELNESDLNSHTLSEDIDTLFEELEKDGATLDTVNEVFNQIYNKYNEALGNSPKSSEETKDELRETLESYNLVDEEGNITSMEEAIAALLGDLLGNKDSSDDSEDEEQAAAAITLCKMLNPYYEGEEVTSEEASAIATELKKFVNSKLPTKEVATGFKVAGIVWGVFVLAWAIKLLQCIICLFKKKPYIRVEVIGIIAGIVQVILALISGLLILAFKFGFITTLVRLPVIGGLIAAIPFLGSSGVGLELTFSAFVPGILVLVNLVYSIIYGFVKRSFKRSL